VPSVVFPAKAGIQSWAHLDARFRWHDERKEMQRVHLSAPIALE
jgi:hypothetical protein